MKRPVYSALFLVLFLLASPRLGTPQQPDSSGSASPTARTAGGSGPANVIGREAGTDKGQSAASLCPGDPAQRKPATPDTAEPWRTILAAKRVAVIGMDEYDNKKCSKPPFPCGKRAREQTEISLRKWGRFSLVQDPSEADLVMAAIESSYMDAARDQTWTQLRVFKGPASPAFLAQVQKKLASQLRTYMGPVAMENQVELLWEGWRSNESPEVKNPSSPPIPSFGQLLGLAILDAAGRKLRDKQFEERVKENPYDPQVTAEVGKSIGDAVAGIKDLANDLSGKTARGLHMRLAEEFCRAVAGKEGFASMGAPGGPRPSDNARPTLLGHAPPAPPPSELAQPTESAPPLMWLELAAVLAGGRPIQDVTTRVKERGIAFDADREALWSLQALGAPGALIQAVQAARVENYYEPDPKAWANVRAEVGPTLLQALKTQPGNPVLHFAMARALDGEIPSEEAIAEYRWAVRLKPDFENAHLNLGIALGKKGDLKGAIKELRQVIRLNPGNAWGHDNLGVALDRKGDLDGSIAEHREAVRLKPDSARARVNLGLALDEKRERERALAEYLEAVRLAPRYASAHHALGLALARKGDLAGARPELQEALRLKPNNPTTHNDLGKVLQYQGDLDGAAAEYRQALRLQPDFSEADSNLAHVVRLMGMPGAAEKESRKAVRNNAADPFAHNALGVALLEKGDLHGAMQEFREAVRLKSDYWEAHRNLGAALTREGKLEEGVAELREAVRLKTDVPDIHFLLGQTLERKGDKAGALEAFRQACVLAPQNPEYKAKYEELSRHE